MMVFSTLGDFIAALPFAKAAAGGPISWSTLLGAVIGGAVSLATTLVVERSRVQAAIAAEERRRTEDGRFGARLVLLELEEARTVLETVLGKEQFFWPPTPNFEFDVSAWTENDGRLAAALHEDTWNAVGAPYFSFRYSNLFGDLTEKSAELTLESVQAATGELRSWLRGSHPARSAPGA